MIYDFKCDSCDFQDEFIVSLSLPKEMAVPEICPKCGKGKLEKIESFSVPKYRLTEEGRKNWKQGKSAWEISEYLTPDPHTGNYKDPY